MTPATPPAMSPRYPYPSMLLFLLLSCLLVPSTVGDAPPSRSTIPRSTPNSHYHRLRQAAASADDYETDDASSLLRERPPWNPSPQINDAGYFRSVYKRVPGEWESEVRLGGKHQNALHLEMVQVQVRQVPGDGNCLFHSISTCMAQVVNGTSLQYPHHLGWLYRHSASLRQQAVDCLRQKRKTLFLQGNEYLRADDLVEAAAAQYEISAQEYCDLMQQDSYWGGGPEIVALCNVLKRPIHVYELAAAGPVESRVTKFLRLGAVNTQLSSSTNSNNNNNCFVLRRMACFGSPKFDKKEPFHILSADSRFPDIEPGQQLPSGNHFLAVFPIPEQQAALNEWLENQRNERKQRKKKGKQSVRGGGPDSTISSSSTSDSSSSSSSSLLEEVTRKRMTLEERYRQRQSSSSSPSSTKDISLDDDGDGGSSQGYWSGLWRRIESMFQ